VGGNTKFYGAVLFRMRERDFGAVVHRDGESPAWPLSYGDFAPYYLRAEALYHVHGERGADPTEPPENAPYPLPAISHEPRVQELAEGLRRSGLKPFALPIGVQLNEAEPTASACIRCDTCDGFPCLVEAKSDAHVTCVRPALTHPNVELVTNAFVERLETSATGREVAAGTVPTSSSSHVAPSTPPRCFCAPETTAIPTDWATGLTSLDVTTCFTTIRPCLRSRRNRTRRSFRRRLD
jgi:choline dehydrogenase-like flavoprotein